MTPLPPLGFFAGVAAPLGDYQAIMTATVDSGGASSITFSSIPSTYKHLQIRWIGRTANATTYGGLRLQLGNGSIDTGTSYSTHDLYGDGSSATASGTNPNSNIYSGTITAASLGANIFGAGVVDILDFADANKYKTVSSLAGADANGSGYIYYASGSWRSTSVVNTLSFFSTSGNFAQYTQFALFGLKG